MIGTQVHRILMFNFFDQHRNFSKLLTNVTYSFEN